MYGRSQSPQELHATAKPLHAIFPRYCNVPGVGRAKRNSGESVHCSIVTTTHETAKERQARCNQQRRSIYRSSNDEEVWRAEQKRCNKGSEGTYCRRVHCSNCQTTWWQSTPPIRSHLFSSIGDQRQRIHSTDHAAIARLRTQKLKWCPLFWDLHIPHCGIKACIRAVVSQSKGRHRKKINKLSNLESHNQDPF